MASRMSSSSTIHDINSHLRFLIADDSKVTQRSTQLMVGLIPNAEVVAVAQDGRQAVELARAHQPDIALMDIQMPKMNGLDAIQTMIRRDPKLTCIILSAEKDSNTLRRAMTAGAKGYLIKPFTSQQFVETVTRIIKKLPQVPSSTVQTRPSSPPKNTVPLTSVAITYIRNRRTDSKAVAVFEKLASSPTCEIRWLRHLAIIYVLRGEWQKLGALAERIDLQMAMPNASSIDPS